MGLYFSYRYQKESLKDFLPVQEFANTAENSFEKTMKDLCRNGKIIIDGKELKVNNADRNDVLAKIESITDNENIQQYIKNFAHQDGFLKIAETETKKLILQKHQGTVLFEMNSDFEREHSSFQFKKIDKNTVEIIEKFSLPPSYIKDGKRYTTQDGKPLANVTMVSRLVDDGTGKITNTVQSYHIDGDKLALGLVGDKRSFIRKIIDTIQDFFNNLRKPSLEATSVEPSKKPRPR